MSVAVVLSSLLLLVIFFSGACAEEKQGEPDPLLMKHVSVERGTHIMSLKCGDKTNQGRILSCGHDAIGKSKVEGWAKAASPTRALDYHNHHFNSDRWDLLNLSGSDIVVSAISKSGTTPAPQWTQAIVSTLLLITGNWPPLDGEAALDRAQWVDLRMMPPFVLAEQMKGQERFARRVLKTHLPLDGLRFDPNVKYINVVRDPRDVAWSLYNHYKVVTPAWYGAVNSDPLVGPPVPQFDGKVNSEKQIFNDWILNDNFWAWNFWHHAHTWWSYRHLPNVLHVHFANLKKDTKGEVKRIAGFLGIEVTDDQLEHVLAKTTIESMRVDKLMFSNMADVMFEGGRESFFYKGTNTRWKDVLTQADNDALEKKAKEKVPADLWEFLKTGNYPPTGSKAEL